MRRSEDAEFRHDAPASPLVMPRLNEDECRNKRLLPRNHEAIRTQIETRMAGRP